VTLHANSITEHFTIMSSKVRKLRREREWPDIGETSAVTVPLGVRHAANRLLVVHFQSFIVP